MRESKTRLVAALEIETRPLFLSRAHPGTALDVAEESWIRQLGGPTNKSNPNGLLSNKRYQMNDVRYRAENGSIDKP